MGDVADEMNARLLAAAPAMLDALTMVMVWWDEHEFDTAPSGDGDERNVYDYEPPMVVAARAALRLASQEKQ